MPAIDDFCDDCRSYGPDCPTHYPRPTGYRDKNGEEVWIGHELTDEQGNLCRVVLLADGTFALNPIGTSLIWRMATDRMTIAD